MWRRAFSHAPASQSELLILGIETSCDDTAAAVVRGNGQVLGEAIHSQTNVHVRYVRAHTYTHPSLFTHPHRTGGIVPKVAAELHERNIEGVVNNAMQESGCGYDDLSHVAVTTGPGLAFSLKAGVEFAKQLTKKIK